MVGIEPTTYGLRNRCSATELHWHRQVAIEEIATGVIKTGSPLRVKRRVGDLPIGGISEFSRTPEDGLS